VPVKPRFDSPQNTTFITQDDLERTSSHPSRAFPTIVADPLHPEDLASLRSFFELLAKWDSMEADARDHQIKG
jgi:hypothetical protein